jgi:hypothetical protein
VILGHVDSRRGPAVFNRLRELRPGDEILVGRADGSSVRFLVERTGQYPKSRFPTEEVYYPTLRPTLRLVTCGGEFDVRSRHYRSNVIAFARPRAGLPALTHASSTSKPANWQRDPRLTPLAVRGRGGARGVGAHGAASLRHCRLAMA